VILWWHTLELYVGRGFFPAIRLPYPWRPRWPPYIYLNVVWGGDSSPPSGFSTHGGQDGRPTSHSTLCLRASLPLAAKMAALHLPERYHLPQRCVGRGFLPAIRIPCTWRPRWPPYISFNVMPSGIPAHGGQDGRPTSASTLCLRASLPMAARMAALQTH
jgi:hypothetical protein